MKLLVYIIIVLFFRKIIKFLFKHHNYHTLFRSFFCLVVSTGSIGFSLVSWDSIVSNPLGSSQLSQFINLLMLSYMLVDTIYLLIKPPYRFELLLHHFICVIIYSMYSDYQILSFCAGCEILSAFNWVGIIFPNIEWTSKMFRLYSILFIRLFIWIYTMIFLTNVVVGFRYWIVMILLGIFLLLDIYWLWIIVKNYLGYSQYIKKTIINKKNKIFTNHKIKKM